MASVMRPPKQSNTAGAGLGRKIQNLAGVKDGKTPHLPKNRSLQGRGRINLKAVAEVLAARGLDPTEALVDILYPTDDEGKDIPCRLPADVQARVLNELLQYTQPKLKSIEIKGRIGAAVFNPTDEQARALAEEFLRSKA